MESKLENVTDCDVFISFSEIDIKFTEYIINILNRAHITYYYFPDQKDIPTSTNFVSEISNSLKHAKVLICIISSSSVKSSWVRQELIYARNNKLAIIPFKVAQFEPPAEFKFLISDTNFREAENILIEENYILERIKFEIHNWKVRNGEVVVTIEPIVNQEIVPCGKNSSATPYAGPRPFDAFMQDKFFGREGDTSQIIKLLNDLRIMVLHAPSGAGKSSLLSAKIAPELRRMQIQVFPHEGATGPLRVSGFDREVVDVNSGINWFVYSLMMGISQNDQFEKLAELPAFLKAIYRPANAIERIIIIDQFEEIFFAQYSDLYKDRKKFINSLIEALEADSSLKFILSLRKEYLADIETLLKPIPNTFNIDKYSLQPIDLNGARQAITKPVEKYVQFEEKALDGLIDQLRKIKVKDHNGTITYREGEFIELAHLQIACLRLWRSLSSGTLEINVDNVRKAAGDGKKFEEFVVDALSQFYIETVETVAKELNFSKEQIFFGCLKFVSHQGTRIMLKSHKGRTGRLPDKVVERLVDYYLLRRESRGAELWYELSHDLLSEPVIKYRNEDRNTIALLFATELLNQALDKVKHENNGNFEGYFVKHRDLVKECRALSSHAGLFEEEQEFILRASIASGIDIHDWCIRVGKDYPCLRKKILNEAINSNSVIVRKNAIYAICEVYIEDLFENVTELTITDTEESIRVSGSLGLSKVDQLKWYQWLVNSYEKNQCKEQVIDALALIYTISNKSNKTKRFSSFFKSLPTPLKREITVRSWKQRVRETWPLLLSVFIMAATFAALIAAPYKIIPGYLNWGVSQHASQPIIGMFQGAVAGVFWGGLITFGVTLFHTVFSGMKESISPLRPFGSIFFGAISGLFASMIITVAIIGVFNIDSLLKMGWITPGKTDPNVLWESFIVTRFGWINLITGTGLGIGIALMSNVIFSSEKWSFLLHDTSRIESFVQLRKIFQQIVSLVWTKFWILCCVIFITAVLSFFIPNIDSSVEITINNKANSLALIQGLIGDCSTQAIGAFFGIVGMLLAIIIVQHGILIEPLRNRI